MQWTPSTTRSDSWIENQKELLGPASFDPKHTQKYYIAFIDSELHLEKI